MCSSVPELPEEQQDHRLPPAGCGQPGGLGETSLPVPAAWPAAAVQPNRLLFLFQFYRPLNVRVALTGLEVWSDRNRIRVEKSPADTLNNFLEWRTRDLLPRLRHDNAQLIM